MKKALAVLLAALMMLGSCICAFAADTAQTGTLKMIAYNVSGIPLVGDFQGTTFTTTRDRAVKIGKLLNSTDVDFIGTEEDFNGHKYLAEQMTAYPYRSYNSGGLAQGQGLNAFSCHPLYNVQRVTWEKEYGYLSGSMDAIANKGFIYSLMEFTEGVYIHVINVHMDAGYDILSVRARRDNFRQLAAFIHENLNDGRALIVQGDFNYKFRRHLADDIYNNLLVPTGLRDVWVELCNGGNYDDKDPNFVDDAEGDTLDRILYRSGTDLTLEPVSKTVPPLTSEKGDRYTDHNPMLTEFRYTRTGKTLEKPSTLEEPTGESDRVLAVKEIGWTFYRLLQFMLGLVELPYLIVQAFDLILNGKMP